MPCEHLETFDAQDQASLPGVEASRPNECDACEQCHDCCTCEVCEHCDNRGSDILCTGCSSSRRQRCRENCCECVMCNECHERSVDLVICETCDMCREDCCECAFCERCESYVRSRRMCSECERCEDCECTCERGCGILIERGLEFFEATRAQHKRNPSKRFFGAEIEAAKFDTDAGGYISSVASAWECSIVEDGSLPTGGFELVTSPANGDLWCAQVEEVAKALKHANAQATAACGLHVHVDARDFTHYDMRRLVMLYAAIEPALFMTQPESRRMNSYCKPCGGMYSRGLYDATTPKDSKRMLMENVYAMTPGKDVRIPKRTKYANSRYHALNLHSWMYRGTIECRLHTGSVRSEKIVPWGMLWANLLDYAMQTTERDAKKVMAELGASIHYSATQAQIWRQQEWILSTLVGKEIREYLINRWSRFYSVAPAVMQERAA